MAKYEQIVWKRDVPLRYEADVAVLGGGMAGVSAACAAARSGAKVILIERFAVTGGNATTGGVAAFCGETAGQGEVFDRIISDLEQFQAVAPYVPYPQADHRLFDHEILAVVLQELLLRHNVKLLLHTQLVDAAVSDDGLIKEIIVSGKSGPEALRAKQYIDCTGEAQAAHLAGFATMKGRPGDGVQLPMSLMFFVRHVQEEQQVKQVPEGWFRAIRDKDDMPMTTKWPNGPGSNAIKLKIPMFDATDTESATAAEIQARRRMMEVLDYYQRVENRPWLLDHCSPQIGIREGRRIVGDYMLTVDDLRAARKFDDAIARGVYYLDAHKPDDDKRTYVLDKKELKVPPYQLPLRSLIVKDAKNLLAAGRCLSADQLALSSARVMTTCSMMGQAAGVAAAESVRQKCNPRDLDHMAIRKNVEKRGANLEV
ncbi:FAD-dependent oxidoreductase [Paenibacillus thalictri]|uniref:FAD-dependent oxidoreductase n=1 Tax=Paenibacillus thalictri TaxID=2527873 RepID=A0A4Q9DGI3_9BACL|nr:FAD-dependent oxidoreductase [Paenibacillus thalictri]TBL71407.1 FAD-dependent oxidoreductase [Paenibacillus thalictri]